MVYFGLTLANLGHTNVIKYCNRPFESVDEMNEAIISNYNERVNPHDIVYMLGDIALVKGNEPQRAKAINDLLSRMNGQKFLIFGNHDKDLRKEKFHRFFKWVGDYKEISVEGQKLILMHYSLRTWNRQHKGAWQLYGHSHNNLPELPTLMSMDIGIDAHDYKPISFEEIKEHMEAKIKFADKNSLKVTEDHHTDTRE